MARPRRGTVVFRKTLRRAQLIDFMASRPACRVAMEACATAHWWARQLEAMGHAIRLVPPVCVKPFVKRQSKADQKSIRGIDSPPNDMADAEAIAEAAMRPRSSWSAPTD